MTIKKIKMILHIASSKFNLKKGMSDSQQYTLYVKRLSQQV